MADNYLEYRREDYEKRKAQWLNKQKNAHLIYKGGAATPKDKAGATSGQTTNETKLTKQ